MKTKLLILLFLLTSLITPMTGSAGPRGQIVAIDNSVFVAMVDTSIEDCICIQEKENWCWAACVQMILRYNGQYVSQCDIAARVLGDSFNRTASGNQIESAFDGWLGYSVHSYQSKKSRYFIDEISSGHPLIIGIGGTRISSDTHLLQKDLERTIASVQGHIDKPDIRQRGDNGVG